MDLDSRRRREKCLVIVGGLSEFPVVASIIIPGSSPGSDGESGAHRPPRLTREEASVSRYINDCEDLVRGVGSRVTVAVDSTKILMTDGGSGRKTWTGTSQASIPRKSIHPGNIMRLPPRPWPHARTPRPPTTTRNLESARCCRGATNALAQPYSMSRTLPWTCGVVPVTDCVSRSMLLRFILDNSGPLRVIVVRPRKPLLDNRVCKGADAR